MSKATEILSDEHRLIEQVMNALEGIVMIAQENQRLDIQAASQALDFIKTFADGFHHAKEENDLFVQMEERGMSRDAGPLAVMLHEHNVGRDCVVTMRNNLMGAATGDAPALASFIEAVDDYVALLRNHIMKEDRILYPMSDNVLSEADQDAMLARFQALGEKEVALVEKYRGIARRLSEDFQTSGGCSEDSEGCGGCCGAD